MCVCIYKSVLLTTIMFNLTIKEISIEVDLVDEMVCFCYEKFKLSPNQLVLETSKSIPTTHNCLCQMTKQKYSYLVLLLTLDKKKKKCTSITATYFTF